MEVDRSNNQEYVYWDELYNLHGGLVISEDMKPVMSRKKYYLDCHHTKLMKLEVEKSVDHVLHDLKNSGGNQGGLSTEDAYTHFLKAGNDRERFERAMTEEKLKLREENKLKEKEEQ